MPWDEIELFLAIQRAGSLAGAASALGINATTVGRRLAAAETRLGTKLLQKTPDGYIATPAGASMIDSAQVMERHAGLIERGLSGADARYEGKVRLALTADFALHFLVQHLGEFQHIHPNIEVELLTGLNRADLSRGDADLAIRFGMPGAGPPSGTSVVDILAQRCGSIGVALYYSDSYAQRYGAPPSATDLDGHRLVVPGDSAPYLPGSDWFADKGRNARVVMRVDDLPPTTAAVSSGIGIGAVPCFIARNAGLKRLEGPALIAERHIWLLCPQDLRRVARVRALRDFLATTLQANAQLLSGATLTAFVGVTD